MHDVPAAPYAAATAARRRNQAGYMCDENTQLSRTEMRYVLLLRCLRRCSMRHLLPSRRASDQAWDPVVEAHMWERQGGRTPTTSQLQHTYSHRDTLHTSGRSDKTGSFTFNLWARTSLNDAGAPPVVAAVRISSLALSNQPVINVLRASSPVPNSEFTAASESG